MNHKHEALWPLKNYKLHIVHVHWFYLIFFISSLDRGLIWFITNLVPLYYHAHSKFVCLCLGLAKNDIKILVYYILWKLYITIFRWKWFTTSVLSLIINVLLIWKITYLDHFVKHVVILFDDILEMLEKLVTTPLNFNVLFCHLIQGISYVKNCYGCLKILFTWCLWIWMAKSWGWHIGS
jgi:hypothetical protein